MVPSQTIGAKVWLVERTPFNPVRVLPRPLQSGHEKCQQERDDAHDHKQFDETERRPVRRG